MSSKDIDDNYVNNNIKQDELARASEDNEDLGFIDNTGALFQGAVNSIFASFFGQDAYPTIEEKACRL